MQRLLASIASIAVAAHVVLGCCWHHTYCGGEETPIAAKSVRHSCCSTHRHGSPNEDAAGPSENSGKRDDGHGERPGCCEEKCNFVCIEKQHQDVAPLTLASIFYLSEAPAKVSQPMLGSEWSLAASDFAQHVPIYLAHQILLI